MRDTTKIAENTSLDLLYIVLIVQLVEFTLHYKFWPVRTNFYCKSLLCNQTWKEKKESDKIRQMHTSHKNPFLFPASTVYSLHGSVCRALFDNPKSRQTYTQHTHTHTMSPFLWADLTALALRVMELHPANPCRSATGAIPMESQTFQAFVKAGPRQAFLHRCTRSHLTQPFDLQHLTTVLLLV